jgi:PhnB protein
MATNHLPEGNHALAPYLSVKNAQAAIEFYKQVFNAAEVLRLTMPDGRIGHAEIKIEGSTVMLADEFPEMGFVSPLALGDQRPPVAVHLYVADVDSTYKSALIAGAQSLREPTDQFYGDRDGQIRDPFGHVWHIATHKEDVAPAEMKRRMEQTLAQGKLE